MSTNEKEYKMNRKLPEFSKERKKKEKRGEGRKIENSDKTMGKRSGARTQKHEFCWR